MITDALLELGVVAAGDAPETIDTDLGLRALNRLVDQWAAERLTIYTVTRSTFAIVSGTQNYTVGSGGTVNIARPVYLDAVRFSDSSTSPAVEHALISYDDTEWQRVAIKTLTAPLPSAYYYNPTYPTGTLSLWPAPTSSTLTGVVYHPQATAEFASLDTAVALPPGYRAMIITNLALELAPSYEKQPHPTLVENARRSLIVIKRANHRLTELQMPADVLGSVGRFGYDIRNG